MNWPRQHGYVLALCLLLADCICTADRALERQQSSASLYKSDRDASSDSGQGAQSAGEKGGSATCEKVNACDDLLGYEAIQALHQQLDDDDNGSVDVAETDEFLRDELQYENGYERQKKFHGNDKYISLEELWQSWQVSEVHNWTMEETIEWLVSCVELPQYVKAFEENGVDGSTLPRMAIANNNFLSSVLGIKDVIHKQKLTLKAMDVVLFGPPKHHNYVKDVLLVMSLVIAIGGCWFAYIQHNYSQSHLKKMMKDMDSLQKAEEALTDLQRELDKAKMEQETAVILKQRLEDEILAAKQERELWSSDPEQTSTLVERLQDEVQKLREQLAAAQAALSSAVRGAGGHGWAPPPALQHWLQLTYELELRHYNSKKAAAEKQLFAAKEGCEKLRKKRSSFMGSFRIAHGSSIDDIDNRILQAKAALSEVTKDLQERLQRWKQIERLCAFSIVNNQGLGHLETVLRGSFLNGSTATLQHSHSVGKKMSRSGSEGTLAEEDPHGQYAASVGAGSVTSMASLLSFRCPERPSTLPVGAAAKSNGSSSQKLSLLDETEDDEDPEFADSCATQATHSAATTPGIVAFSVGDGSPPELAPLTSLTRPRSAQWLNKAQSQDGLVDRKISTCSEPAVPSELSAHSSNAASPATDHAPTLLTAEAIVLPRPPLTSSASMERRKKAGNILVAALKGGFSGSAGGGLDEENSTDSNSTADDDSLREKKKKASIFQPLKKKKSKAM
uniref:Putative conserved plasma membrane protein n=1 Tax=Ixodes scapularis TaxID=6945 RepID=A0A4D5RIF5_IXOSC